MRDIIEGLLYLAGAMLAILSGLGIVRLPDPFTRMQGASKVGVLGGSLILLGVALHFGTWATTARCLVAIFFVLLTTPIATHLLTRAAYFAGEVLWEKTLDDAVATENADTLE